MVQGFGDVALTDVSQYRLLIADDHPLFRGALGEAVNGLLQHTTIVEAGTFDEVADLLEREGDVDLILLDLAMPRMDGYEALRRLREAPGMGGTFVVCITGYAQEVYRDRALRAGCDAYLVKPADPDELRWSIDQGGVGATCNPVIAHTVLKHRIAEWRPRITTLMLERPGATEDEIAWAAVEALSVDAAALLLPAFSAHRGRNGRLSIQTDPRLFQNAAAMSMTIVTPQTTKSAW